MHLTPQRSLCNNPKNTFFIISPSSTPPPFLRTSISAGNLAPYFTGKNRIIHTKILFFPLNTTNVPTASALPVRRKKWLSFIFSPSHVKRFYNLYISTNFQKHIFKKQNQKTLPYTPCSANSIPQIVLSFLCLFLLSAQPLHIVVQLPIQHSTFIHKNLLGWFYPVSWSGS